MFIFALDIPKDNHKLQGLSSSLNIHYKNVITHHLLFYSQWKWITYSLLNNSRCIHDVLVMLICGLLNVLHFERGHIITETAIILSEKIWWEIFPFEKWLKNPIPLPEIAC